ncbi:hypothetical protein BE21_52760 [Sorangium cellulosum]|uniref:Serine protease n=1 Tax=Sorangium cellulosum TaxID=56 RepID=A0A150TEW2_SORCE|nr:hypothetical protein BE21_52760 [Sorangium cellulosum]
MGYDQSSLTKLRKILAPLYPREAEQRRLIRDAGLDETLIALDRSAANSWSEILNHASRRPGKVEAIIKLALEEHPENELLLRAGEDRPPEPLLGDAIFAWAGPRNAGALHEKIIGEASALVPTSYLALGLKCARAVAKVRLASGNVGSAFLTGENTLITNHHVLPDPSSAARAVAVFDFEQTLEGVDVKATEVRLLPDRFFAASEEDDWAAVSVEEHANDRWGKLALRPASVKAGDRVNIIQHPGGGYKQMSFFANTVAFVGQRRVQYLTDTLPGSSGSPVFDRSWNVVALHHAGGWLREPSGDPKHAYLRNEGILIDAVIDGLARARRAGRGGA